VKAANLILLPSSLAAVALLGLNDHVLKAQFPGFLTGKLSDFAGLYFFPFFLLSTAATLVPAAGSKRALGVACWLTALVFSGVNLFPGISELYEHFVASIWHELGRTRPVVHVADGEDLIALPMAGLAYWVGSRRIRDQTGFWNRTTL
jgi:hypothetical protein